VTPEETQGLGNLCSIQRGNKTKNLAGIAARLLGMELYPAKPPDF
jgi:hypothetical protein